MTEVFETLTGINMMQPYLLLDLPKSWRTVVSVGSQP